MGIRALFAVVVVWTSISMVTAAIPTDSIGEGSIVGFLPLPTDTVSDTSFHVGL